ncbi:MAG: hypothetical protein HJHJAOHD_02538 [Flavobacteriales bacterium]|nr:hypothetical protein [Flavobacteriales bacterium]
MEQDKQSSSYTTYFRQYDPRIARWKSTDPVTQPWQSPYTAFDNNPIFYTDPSGAIAVPNKRRGIGAGGSIGGIGGALAGSAQTALSLAIRSGMQASMVGTYMQSAFLPTSSATSSGREFGVGKSESNSANNSHLYSTGGDSFIENENNHFINNPQITNSIKIDSPEDFGPGSIHDTPFKVNDKTKAVFNNLKHPDVVEIRNAENNEVIYPVNNGKPFIEESQVINFGFIFEEMEFKNFKTLDVIIRIKGGRTEPTAFKYEVWNALQTGGSVHYPFTAPMFEGPKLPDW